MDRDNYVPGTAVLKPVVKLTGANGNAFNIIAFCNRALNNSGAPHAACVAFRKEAMGGDYDNVLRTAMKYCDVR